MVAWGSGISRETGFRRWHWSTALVNPYPNPKHGPRPPSLHGGWLLPACTEHRRLLRSYGFKVKYKINVACLACRHTLIYLTRRESVP